VNITILSVTIATVPTAKGSYQVADVAYKNNTFQGKVEGKKVMSFGATANGFKALSTAQPGETYEVEVVKNDKGYNDWVSLQKAGAIGGGAVNTPAMSVSGARPGSSPTPRSTYETPEERAAKQVFIVRQSSLATAERMLSVGAKAPVKVDDIISAAQKLEAYVFAKPKLGGESGFDDVPDFDFEETPNVT
jgi:hypothetical protein